MSSRTQRSSRRQPLCKRPDMGKPKQPASQMVVPEAFGTLGLELLPAMPLENRLKLIHNLGHPADFQLPMAIQDRASSVMRQLSLLVEQSGDPRLIEKANEWLSTWNQECEPVFLEMFRAEEARGDERLRLYKSERKKPFPGWPGNTST